MCNLIEHLRIKKKIINNNNKKKLNIKIINKIKFYKN